MLNLALAVMVFTAGVGILQMELGAFGPDIGYTGSPNGATLAYAFHAAFLYAGYLVTCRIFNRRPAGPGAPQGLPGELSQANASLTAAQSVRSFQKLAYLSAGLQIAILLTVMYGLGAIDVLMLRMGRGDFRVSFGRLGPVAYLLRDFLSPTLGALVAAVYVLRKRTDFESRALLGLNLGIVSACAFLWGYRTSAVYYLIPSFLLLFPVLDWKRALLFIASASILIVLSQAYLGEVGMEESAVSMMDRATVGSGNSAWKIWDIYQNNEEFPPYWPTLTACLGNNIASGLGLSARGEDRWFYQNYPALATWVVKDYALGLNAQTSNVSTTSFGGGVIALGSPGYLLFSLFSGVVAALNRVCLERKFLRRKLSATAAAANFFTAATLPFVNSGDFATILGVWILINGSFTYVVCRLLIRWSGVEQQQGDERRVSPEAARSAPVQDLT